MVQLLANELKRYITISPVCDVKNSNSFSPVCGTSAPLGLFFIERKDLTKMKVGQFIFLALNQLKTVRSSDPRVHLQVFG